MYKQTSPIMGHRFLGSLSEWALLGGFYYLKMWCVKSVHAEHMFALGFVSFIPWQKLQVRRVASKFVSPDHTGAFVGSGPRWFAATPCTYDHEELIFDLLVPVWSSQGTHTGPRRGAESRRGAMEGTRAASHNKLRGTKRKNNEGRQHAEGARNKQEEQGKRSRECGVKKGSAQEPSPGTRKSISAKQNKQQSKTPAARQVKQDSIWK